LDVIESAMREGAVSWACWLAARETNSARRLRVLTPKAVSDRVGSGLPLSAEQRDHRRQVVDLEIEEMMSPDAVEIDEQEVA